MAAVFLIALLALLPEAGAQVETTVIGGPEGIRWGDEGDIPPTVIRGNTSVEETNAPGGVIDFGTAERPDWIFPQQVDTERNIMIGLTSPERGGSLETPTLSLRALEGQLSKMIDDDGDTALEVRPERAGESTRASGFIMQFDLGAVFALNRIRFFPRNADPAFPAPGFPNQKDFLKSFEILENDGAPESESNGVLIFETLETVAKNEEPVVDLRIEPRFVRHLRLKVLTNTEFEIAEFQAFAQGFVPEATYVSNIIDFGTPTLLGNIRWVEEQLGDPLRSEMRIRTRTGVDPGTVVFPRVGLQPSGRIDLQVAQGDILEVDIPIEALWKRADAIEDGELREIVETVLDNPELDGREVLLLYNELPLEQRAALEIDQEYYRREVDRAERGDLREDLTNWSPWSAPYPAAGIVDPESLGEAGGGTAVSSPGPRRYFQFMVEFANDAFDAATGLGGLSFEALSPAFADRLIAEILPRSAAVGERTGFTYAVLCEPAPDGGGFDRIEIDTPTRTPAVGSIEIERGESRQVADFTGAALDALPVTRDGVSIEEVRDDGFVISFPTVEEGAVIKVGFDNSVLRFGTLFTGRARNSAHPGIGQNLVAGNAADLGRDGLEDPDSQPVGSLSPGNLSVSVPITRDLLVNVAAVPGVLTPNRDGVNDGALIRYDITNIAEPRRVRVEVFDLSGRRMASLYDGEDPSGRYARRWNGLNDAGEPVPPGNYIFAVSLDASTGAVKRVGTVGVAY